MANLSNINNKFLVTTGGNVLIGQTAAVGSSILQVTGNVNIGSSLNVEKLEVGGTIRIRVPNTSSATLLLNNTDTQLSIDNTGGNMIFTTAGAAEKMRIESSGTVTITGGTTGGLNITTAGTQDTININRAANNDNAITKYQTASADKWIVGLRNTGDDNFKFYSYGTATDVLTINANGNVGIGTDSPNNPFSAQAALQVGDTSTTTNNGLITIGSGTAGSGDIYFADGTSGGSAYRGFLSYKHNGDYLAFGTNGATQIIINSTGDIYNVVQTNTYQSTFFGINTGNQSASTGLYNQAFGFEVSRLNTTGEKNTGMGHRALYNSTTSSRNTAIGYQTLYNLNASGSDNTAIGYAAGSSLQNAERNIFVGGFCGASTSTGASYNTALGYHALRYGATNQNTAIGYFAMGTSTSVTGGLNTAVGIRSQEDLTTGVNNCALGADALRSITTGSNNIGIGYNVLGDLTVGQANVCIGREAGYGGDFGETVFIGHYAGQNNLQSGTVGIGAQALQNNTNIQNVAVGYQALLTNTSGARNTSLGYKSFITKCTRRRKYSYR